MTCAECARLRDTPLCVCVTFVCVLSMFWCHCSSEHRQLPAATTLLGLHAIFAGYLGDCVEEECFYSHLW